MVGSPPHQQQQQQQPTAAASALLVIWLSSRCFLFAGVLPARLLCVDVLIYCSYDIMMAPRVRIYNMPYGSFGVVVPTRVYVASSRHTL